MTPAAAIPGVMLLQRQLHRDERGGFSEIWQEERYREAGIGERFLQDNMSWSYEGVLRGMHLQYPFPQGKLVSAAHGTVFDVTVDVRRGSPTFGRWAGFELSGENGVQLYLPAGVAHGFLVLSELALVTYKCTAPYVPSAELAILWNDPDVGIEWPRPPRIISPKDAAAPRLRDLPLDRLPPFVPAGPASPPGATPFGKATA